ncbi:MAG: hypothetical protein IH851_07910 [Armatimonadetes bacterium]|nr:hypothetical protein [Armatimonadota bacterium]
MKKFLLPGFLLLLAGCGGGSPDGDESPLGTQTINPDANGAVTSEPAQAGAIGPQEEIASLEHTYAQAKRAHESAPDEEAGQAAFVRATVEYATAVMSGPGDSREKYPQALRLYDEALTLEPGNEEALQNRQMILAIYAEMGREPPKSGE